jgi:hypothetical protein
VQTRFRQWNCLFGFFGHGLLITYIVIQFAGAAVASSITLAWDPNSEPHLAGYNVYRSNQSGSFPSTPLNGTLLRTTSFTDSTTASGTYYYVIRAVSASGGESASSNQVQVTVNSSTVNSAPTVSVGSNGTITLPATAILTATATDDGLPYGALTYTWSVISGTGVVFASPSSNRTQASFSVAGTYTLRVTVSDGQLSSTADVVVTVNAGKQSLAAPTGLTAQCGSNVKTFTVRWNAVAGATSYNVRVDDLANNVNGQWYTDGVDYSLDGYTQTSFTGSVIPGQAYTWLVQATNPSSGIGPSASGSFTCVDPASPMVSISAPLAGAMVSGITTVSASVSNNVNIAGVQFKLNDANLGAEVTTAPYSTLWDTTPFVGGSYSLSAVVRDVSGNQTTSAAVGVVIGVPAPSATAVTTPQVIPDVEQGQIRAGYHIVTPDPESAAPTPTVTFGMVNGGMVQAHTGMVPGLITTDASFVVEVMAEIGRSVGVAIVNPSGSTNTVTLTLRDTNGAIAGSPMTLSLKPYQQFAGFVHDLFSSDATGTEFHGSLRLQSSTPFAALGLRFSGGDFSTLPVTSATSVPNAPSRTFVDGSSASTPLAGTVGGLTALISPQFAMSGGWATQIALLNNNVSTITGRVDVFDTNGNPMAVNLNGAVQSTFTYSILPNGTFVLAPRDANGQPPF